MTTRWRIYPPPDRYTPKIGDNVFIRSKTAKEVGKVGKVLSIVENAAVAADAAAEDIADDQENPDEKAPSTSTTNETSGDGPPANKKRKRVEQTRAVIKISSSDSGTESTSNNREVTARPSRLVKIYTRSHDNTLQSHTGPLTTVIVTPDTTNYRILAASQVLRGDKVLEIGCSTGECTSILARYVSEGASGGESTGSSKAGKVIAFDTGEDMIQTATKRIESLDEAQRIVDFHKVDALQDPKRAFALATSSSSYPHDVFDKNTPLWNLSGYPQPEKLALSVTESGGYYHLETLEEIEAEEEAEKARLKAQEDAVANMEEAPSDKSSKKGACSEKEDTGYPNVIFIDIGGNRELDGVVRMVEWVLDELCLEPPRLVVVKSQELVGEIKAASRNKGSSNGTSVAIDGNGRLQNGENWFALLADKLTAARKKALRGNGPPTYLHPLKAPLALSPDDDTTPICRFHNYHPRGCKKDYECDFDHKYCHWCLKPGHVARNCGSGESSDKDIFDFTASTVRIVNCHAEGEVGDVIVSGIGDIPGATLWEKSRYIARDGRLRNYVLQEPRGGVFRHVNLLVNPINPEAKVSFIIMEPEDTPPMSGSNSICVATVALETGIVPITSNNMSFKMEAPGGMVNVSAKCSGVKAEQITVTNVPSFAGILGAKLEVEGIGTLNVDTAFGGDSFVICNADDLGFKILPDEAKDLVDVGMKIARAANEQLKFVHPTNKEWTHFSFCMIAKPIFYENGLAVSHTAVAIQPGKIDRSPTGTGCSARMALLHTKGELKLGDKMIGRSIIGSEFQCFIEEELDLNGIKAIRPSVAGRAWITGTTEHRLDKTDPYPLGYRISDTWPKKL